MGIKIIKEKVFFIWLKLDKNKMEFNEENGRFPKTSRIYVTILFQIKEKLEGKTLLSLFLPSNTIIILLLDLLMS